MRRPGRQGTLPPWQQCPFRAPDFTMQAGSVQGVYIGNGLP